MADPRRPRPSEGLRLCSSIAVAMSEAAAPGLLRTSTSQMRTTRHESCLSSSSTFASRSTFLAILPDRVDGPQCRPSMSSQRPPSTTEYTSQVTELQSRRAAIDAPEILAEAVAKTGANLEFSRKLATPEAPGAIAFLHESVHPTSLAHSAWMSKITWG